MSEEVRRRQGRPDQQTSEEIVRHLLDTASKLFILQGYSATSIEQIASAAGSGKKTLYRHFGSKEQIFHEVIRLHASRLFADAKGAISTYPDPLDALKACCRSMLDFMLRPELLRLYRILISEAERFPGLGEYVIETCMRPFDELGLTLLQTAGDQGRLRVGDPYETYVLMTGLVMGIPVQQALLGRNVLATQEERSAHVEAAWKMFLGGVGASSASATGQAASATPPPSRAG